MDKTILNPTLAQLSSCLRQSHFKEVNKPWALDHDYTAYGTPVWHFARESASLRQTGIVIGWSPDIGAPFGRILMNRTRTRGACDWEIRSIDHDLKLRGIFSDIGEERNSFDAFSGKGDVTFDLFKKADEEKTHIYGGVTEGAALDVHATIAPCVASAVEREWLQILLAMRKLEVEPTFPSLCKYPIF